MPSCNHCVPQHCELDSQLGVYLLTLLELVCFRVHRPMQAPCDHIACEVCPVGQMVRCRRLVVGFNWVSKLCDFVLTHSLCLHAGSARHVPGHTPNIGNLHPFMSLHAQEPGNKSWISIALSADLQDALVCAFAIGGPSYCTLRQDTRELLGLPTCMLPCMSVCLHHCFFRALAQPNNECGRPCAGVQDCRGRRGQVNDQRWRPELSKLTREAFVVQEDTKPCFKTECAGHRRYQGAEE